MSASTKIAYTPLAVTPTLFILNRTFRENVFRAPGQTREQHLDESDNATIYGDDVEDDELIAEENVQAQRTRGEAGVKTNAGPITGNFSFTRSRNRTVKASEKEIPMPVQQSVSLVVRLKIAPEKLAKLLEQRLINAGDQEKVPQKKEIPSLQPRSLLTHRKEAFAKEKASESEGIPAPRSRTPSKARSRSARRGHSYCNNAAPLFLQSCVTKPTRENGHRSSAFSEAFHIRGDRMYLGLLAYITMPKVESHKEGPKAAWRRLFLSEGEMPIEWREKMQWKDGEWVAREETFIPILLDVRREPYWRWRRQHDSN